jgi:hypothetical protein
MSKELSFLYDAGVDGPETSLGLAKGSIPKRAGEPGGDLLFVFLFFFTILRPTLDMRLYTYTSKP